MQVFSSVLEMIGATPMLRISRLDTGPCELYLKLELDNPGGSLKDRIGISMLQEAEKRGELQPGDTVVEATAGNTGIGLALAAAQKAYRLILVVPDKMSQEKVLHLRALGAEVVITRSDVGKGHPEYYQDLGETLAREHHAYFVNQFRNPDNPLAHETTTAPEIYAQMERRLDAIVVGVGSSGMLTGLTHFLKERAPQVEMVLADPAGSMLAHYIETGEQRAAEGGWQVEGIGEDFIPEICDFSMTSRAYSIPDAESFATARTLLLEEGILAGSSTGTLLAAALRYCREQRDAKRVVTFACDTGNKYLSRLHNDFWLRDHGFVPREQHGDLRDLIGRPYGERATVIVTPEDALTTAHNRLRNADLSQLPVMEGERLTGFVSEDDILRFTFDAPERFNEPVRRAMHATFVRVDKSWSLNNLAAMLEAQPYAAVMDGESFLGLVTRADMLNYLRRKLG